MNKKFKFLFIIIAIMLLVGCKKEETAYYENPIRTVSYKGFDFKVPESVSFEEKGVYYFTMTSNEWVASVEIFHDENHLLFNNPDKYYGILKSYSYDVEEAQKIKIGDNELNTYKRHGDLNSVICTSNYIGNFSYQIEYHNATNDFDTTFLNEVIDIMNKGTYRYDDHTVFIYRLMSSIIKE